MYPDCLQDTFEIMDAVLNYSSLVYMIRPWSYEALALIRALHESRYFFNVAQDGPQQKLLLHQTVEAVFSDNTARAEISR